MTKDHTNHDHGHEHAGMLEGDAEPGYYPTRLRAIEALLIEKGICTLAEVECAVNATDLRSAADGARVVARAWLDPEFKARLLTDAISAVSELGYDIPDNMPRLTALENTDKVHYLVVCTLCSCYPWPVLGLPPRWYKYPAYRSRAVIEPRGVLREFGLDIDESVEVRVWDSTSDVRYMVLPQRPSGTYGMGEEELAGLVTRDSMVGVAIVEAPP